jgi:hypothetical protein
MKKYAIFAAIILASCSNNNETKHVDHKTYNLDLPNTYSEITEYTIDGCQYLGNLGGDSRSNYLTHKGNCTNPIHSK